MARSDLLLNLAFAGVTGDRPRVQVTIEALIAEERSKQHHVLADRLSSLLSESMKESTSAQATAPEILDADRFCFRQQPRRELASLFLTPRIQQTCKEIIEEHTRADLLRSYNLEPRNRILLLGPPGNGKTSLAEALACELGVDFFVARYEHLIGSYLGETAQRLNKLFNVARRQPCVLFFDEFDVIGKERGDDQETGEIKRVVSSLLMQIDRLPPYVVAVTATNHAELLDRAVWRRFQVQLQLDRPGRTDIAEWLRQFEKMANVHLGYSYEYLARRLHGWSYGELEQFCQDVLRRHILSMPKDNLKAIVRERLAIWSEREKRSEDK